MCDAVQANGKSTGGVGWVLEIILSHGLVCAWCLELQQPSCAHGGSGEMDRE